MNDTTKRGRQRSRKSPQRGQKNVISLDGVSTINAIPITPRRRNSRDRNHIQQTEELPVKILFFADVSQL
jgi:hypothetical protein